MDQVQDQDWIEIGIKISIAIQSMAIIEMLNLGHEWTIVLVQRFFFWKFS